MRLTPAELVAHPEFEHVFWPLEPTKKGVTPVAKDRGGPIDISWEIHGTGETKLVFIMGLGALKEAWQRQTRDFGHTHAATHSCLILDNRGMGDSGKPLMRYSTSEMARDVLDVLAALGWTAARSLVVVGISMGGMIAQELALLAPERVAGLALVSTAPRVVNTVGWAENLRNRINLFVPRDVAEQVRITEGNMYTREWLDGEDDTEAVVERFPTNGDRFAAAEVWKRRRPDKFGRKGFLCQVLAAGWHHKDAKQLRELGDKVGRGRITVVHGKLDKMLAFKLGEMLFEELGGEEAGVTKAYFDDVGHVVPVEKRKEFFELITDLIRRGKEENRKEQAGK